MVTITSEEEQALLTQILDTKTIPDGLVEYFYWIGALEQSSQWQWITEEEFSYTHWGSKEPDDELMYQWHIGFCSNLSSDFNNHAKIGDWEDIEHTRNEGFICEWMPNIEESEHYFTDWQTTSEATCFTEGERLRICTHCGLKETETLNIIKHSFIFNEINGINSCEHCGAAMYDGRIYKIFSKSLSWYDAYSYCQSLGGHLVTVTSAEEQTFIENYMKSDSYSARTWLGGYNDGTGFKWITDELFEYSNRMSGQPDCDGSTAFFLAMNREKSSFGKWHDHDPCIVNKYFICEWEATE